MKRILFALVTWRGFAASTLAFCLVGGSAMSIGADKQRIKAQSRANSKSSPMTEVTERMTGLNSVSGPAASVSGGKDEASRAHINEAYGKLPLSFEANVGQANSDVKFISRDGHRSVSLTSDGAVMTLTKAPRHRAGRYRESTIQRPELNPRSRNQNLQSSVVRFKFVGASASSRISGLEQLSGTSNYLRGNDPQRWHTNVANYAKVKYESLYSGVDLIYYGNGQRLEYDLILAPGANPKPIAFDVQGATRLTLDRKGALVAHTPAGDLRQEKPLIYQENSGVKQFIAGRYVMKGRQRVGFKVADYDASKPLVIDPTLKYSFKFGGSANDQVTGIAVDSTGNAYLMGQTMSSDFPTKNPINGTLRGQTDTFVTKLNADGNAIVYSTYLGGSQSEFSGGIAVDSSGSAYVTGQTFSTDFPTTAGAFQTHSGGTFDAFVAKLNPDGNALVYSTFLGGSQGEGGSGIAVDSSGSAYVTGVTGSGNFPTVNPFQPAPGFSSFGSNAFVTKLNPTGSALVYSSYLGGSGGAGGSSNGDKGSAIAVDRAGNAYVTGSTASTNFPTTTGAFQTAHGGAVFDAFVTKVSAAGALSYSTYLGGSGNDFGAGIAVDGPGNAYVTGGTGSANFPTASPFQSSLRNALNAFVTKLNASGSALVYSSYLGGTGGDIANGIAVDSVGNAYVIGTTSSIDFPTASPVQNALSGPSDAFVTQLSPAGNSVSLSTYLGGSGNENGNAIAIDASGSTDYLGITSSSSDFPKANSRGIAPQDATDKAQAASIRNAPPLPAVDVGISVQAFSRGIRSRLVITDFSLIVSFEVQNFSDNPALNVTFTITSGCGEFVRTVNNSDVPFNVELGFNHQINFSVPDPLKKGKIVRGQIQYSARELDLSCVNDFGADIEGKVNTASPDTNDSNNISHKRVELYLSCQVPNNDLIDVLLHILRQTGISAGDGELWKVEPPPASQANVLIGTADKAGVYRHGLRSTQVPLTQSVPTLLGFKVYSSLQPNVQPTAQNLFATVPPDRNFVDVSTAPPDSYFRLTTLSDIGESAPSNEVGGPLPNLKSVTVDDSSISAKGSGFTDQVELLFGGLPFVSPAKVRKQGKKITQSGNLVTGQSIGEFMQQFVDPGAIVYITFRNSDGNGLAFPVKR